MEDTQVTLRDTIEQSFDNVIEAADIQPEVSGESRTRDESGKFVSKEVAPEPATLSQEAPAAPVVAETPARPRPSSWKKDYEEHWGKLDPNLQEYILKRESDYATGVSTYKQEAERAKDLHEAFAPLMPDLERYQVSPARWLSDVSAIQRTLMNGSPQEKVQVFQKMMRDYGVEPTWLNSSEQIMQQDPQVAYLSQKLQQLEQGWSQFQTARQQEEYTQLSNVYENFVSDIEAHPHIENEQVRETMAQLLERGLAPDLETAYHKAIRLNDDAWEAEQARKQQAEESQRQKAAEKARAQAVSPRTATPSGAVSTGKKDRASLLSDAFDNVAVGRL